MFTTNKGKLACQHHDDLLTYCECMQHRSSCSRWGELGCGGGRELLYLKQFGGTEVRGSQIQLWVGSWWVHARFTVLQPSHLLHCMWSSVTGHSLQCSECWFAEEGAFKLINITEVPGNKMPTGFCLWLLVLMLHQQGRCIRQCMFDTGDTFVSWWTSQAWKLAWTVQTHSLAAGFWARPSLFTYLQLCQHKEMLSGTSHCKPKRSRVEWLYVCERAPQWP